MNYFLTLKVVLLGRSMRLKLIAVFCAASCLATPGTAWSQAQVAVRVGQAAFPAAVKFGEFVGSVTGAFGSGLIKGIAEGLGRELGSKPLSGDNPPHRTDDGNAKSGDTCSPPPSILKVSDPRLRIAALEPGWRIITRARHCVKPIDKNVCYPCDLDASKQTCRLLDGEKPINLTCVNSTCQAVLPDGRGPYSPAPKPLNIQVLYSSRAHEAVRIHNALRQKGYNPEVKFVNFSMIDDRPPGSTRVIYKSYAKTDCIKLQQTLMRSIRSSKIVFQEHNTFLNGDIQIQLF